MFFYNDNAIKAASYSRLSREDGDKMESDSIRNQKDLIADYAKQKGINIVSEYVDDGYSGTNFERPNFQRMMEDAKKKKAACGGTVIYEDFLKIMIMDQIHVLIKGMCDRKKMLEMVNTSQGGKNALLSAQKKMLALNVKIAETEEKQTKLYENFADGLLEQEDYQSIRERYIAETQRMQDELAALEQKKRMMERTVKEYTGVVKHLEAYLDNRDFNPALVKELVERISFSKDGSVEITYKCDDVYKRVIEITEGGEDI